VQLFKIGTAEAPHFPAFEDQGAYLAGAHETVNHRPESCKVNFLQVKVFHPLPALFGAVHGAVEIPHALDRGSMYRLPAHSAGLLRSFSL
jgi:hypothetical protein